MSLKVLTINLLILGLLFNSSCKKETQELLSTKVSKRKLNNGIELSNDWPPHYKESGKHKIMPVINGRIFKHMNQKSFRSFN